MNLIRWLSHVRGKINAEEATYLREKDFPKVFFVARVWGLIFFVTLASAFFLNSFVPLLPCCYPSFVRHVANEYDRRAATFGHGRERN